MIEFSVLDKIPDQQHEFLGKITVGPKDNANCLLTNKIEMGINEVFERKVCFGDIFLLCASRSVSLLLYV